MTNPANSRDKQQRIFLGVLALFFAYRIRKRDDAKAANGETGDDDPKAKANGDVRKR